MEAKQVKRVEVASFALSMAVVHAIVAFIAGIVMAVCFVAFLHDVPLFVSGLMVIFYPIFGFIGGFIGGFIYAVIYNFLSARYESVRFRGESDGRK